MVGFIPTTFDGGPGGGGVQVTSLPVDCKVPM